MAVTLVIYVAVSLAISLFMNWYNDRIALLRA
jgi:ABC-type amino acid transport system permease subunit